MNRRINHFLKWLKCIRAAIETTCHEYVDTTKVSGIWLLASHRTHGISKFIWAVVLFNVLLLAVYLSLQLWMDFYSYPILNTIAPDLAIKDIPFPAVTVCNANAVDTKRAILFARQLYIPIEYDLMEAVDGLEAIGAFTNRDVKFAFNNTRLEITDEILQLNNISIYEAYMNIRSSCDDIVRRCFWGVTEFPCHNNNSYLFFNPSISHLGSCCTFKYSTDTTSASVPFPVKLFGVNGGLNIIGSAITDANVLSHPKVYVHHSLDLPIEVAILSTITSKLESFLEISPIVHSASKDVLELTQKKRGCMTSSDVEQNIYRQAECIHLCHGMAIFTACKCFPYHFSSPSPKHLQNECKLTDILCIIANYDSLNSITCTQCLPNCYDITYSANIYIGGLQVHNKSVSKLHTHPDFTQDSFVVRVYLEKGSVSSVRKEIVTSWISLLSDLGGVFNLCLGLSFISLVELFYYCTCRLHRNVQLQKKANSSIK